MTAKTCKKCGESKSVDDFYVRAGRYVRSACKACERAYVQDWRSRNPEKVIETRASYPREKKRASERASYYRHHEKQLQAQREYNKSVGPERRRKWQLSTKYKISEEQYDEMLARQGGKCAICSGDPDGRFKRLNVDHDHESGRVRMLLCCRCNRGLGYFGDNSELLRLASEYLERFE